MLLITDGLDRDDPAGLAREMERLHLSARELVWLNPLLRWDGFTPRARGVRAMLPMSTGSAPVTTSPRWRRSSPKWGPAPASPRSKGARNRTAEP